MLDLCQSCAVVEAEVRAYAGRLRAESLAAIRRTAKTLVQEGFEPTEAFTWRYRTESAWWAFGRFGRRQVAVPLRLGWPVGDYPWDGQVQVARGTSTSEVFVKPTYVDADGAIAPIEATRGSVLNPDVFTDEMCAEIAATLLAVLGTARSLIASPDDPGYT